VAVLRKLAHITLVVRDQAAALAFYTEKMGLEKRADLDLAPGIRWLTVGVPGQELDIALFQPGVQGWHTPEQVERLFALVGKNPHAVFHSDDCRNDAAAMKERGVRFVSDPTEKPWGLEAVFLDLYDNSYSLLEPLPGGVALVRERLPPPPR
jgi:catechol 2,3-dioxygenase-like lactoylglutathione lyase family enzyme